MEKWETSKHTVAPRALQDIATDGRIVQIFGQCRTIQTVFLFRLFLSFLSFFSLLFRRKPPYQFDVCRCGQSVIWLITVVKPAREHLRRVQRTDRWFLVVFLFSTRPENFLSAMTAICTYVHACAFCLRKSFRSRTETTGRIYIIAPVILSRIGHRMDRGRKNRKRGSRVSLINLIEPIERISDI